MRICGICDEELKNEDEIVACNECNGLYHLECFEETGGCANPSCRNYVAPTLSLSDLSQSYETDDTIDIDDESDYQFEEYDNNDYTEADKENEEDYEINDGENSDLKDTPPQKSFFAKIVEWLIFFGLIAATIFLLLIILKK